MTIPPDGPLLALMRTLSPDMAAGVDAARRKRIREEQRWVVPAYLDPHRSTGGAEAIFSELSADRERAARHRTAQAEYRRQLAADPVLRLADGVERRLTGIEKRLDAVEAA